MVDRDILIGRRMRVARIMNGWSQRDAAHRYGCTDAAISRMERGLTKIPVSNLERLAEILGQPLDYSLQDEPQYEQRPTPAAAIEEKAPGIFRPRAIPVRGSGGRCSGILPGYRGGFASWTRNWRISTRRSPMGSLAPTWRTRSRTGNIRRRSSRRKVTFVTSSPGGLHSPTSVKPKRGPYFLFYR